MSDVSRAWPSTGSTSRRSTAGTGSARSRASSPGAERPRACEAAAVALTARAEYRRPSRMLRALFPSQRFAPRAIDRDFERERVACRNAGLSAALVDHTGAVRGDVEAAVSAVAAGSGLGVYRGWMLR